MVLLEPRSGLEWCEPFLASIGQAQSHHAAAVQTEVCGFFIRRAAPYDFALVRGGRGCEGDFPLQGAAIVGIVRPDGPALLSRDQEPMPVGQSAEDRGGPEIVIGA